MKKENKKSRYNRLVEELLNNGIDCYLVLDNGVEFQEYNVSEGNEVASVFHYKSNVREISLFDRVDRLFINNNRANSELIDKTIMSLAYRLFYMNQNVSRVKLHRVVDDFIEEVMYIIRYNNDDIIRSIANIKPQKILIDVDRISTSTNVIYVGYAQYFDRSEKISISKRLNNKENNEKTHKLILDKVNEHIGVSEHLKISLSIIAKELGLSKRTVSRQVDKDKDLKKLIIESNKTRRLNIKECFLLSCFELAKSWDIDSKLFFKIFNIMSDRRVISKLVTVGA